MSNCYSFVFNLGNFDDFPELTYFMNMFYSDSKRDSNFYDIFITPEVYNELVRWNNKAINYISKMDELSIDFKKLLYNHTILNEILSSMKSFIESGMYPIYKNTLKEETDLHVLKPCPVCGEVQGNKLHIVDTGQDKEDRIWYTVICEKCGCSIPECVGKENCEKHWNDFCERAFFIKNNKEMR